MYKLYPTTGYTTFFHPNIGRTNISRQSNLPRRMAIFVSPSTSALQFVVDLFKPQTMISKYLSLSILIVFSLCFSCTPPQPEEDALPNIVFIFADDMGYGDLTSYNPDSKINTTNIDKLAEEGMRFMDTHSPAAVCVPSRYALLTGHYPFLNNRKYGEGVIETGRPTLASVLQSAGYQTACIGKWHQGIINEKNPPVDTDLRGGPLDHGFDYFYGMPASLDIQPYYYIENKRPVHLPTDSIAPMEGTAPAEGKRKIQGPFYRGGNVAPDFKHEKVLDHFASKATSYIQTASAKKDTPFFLYLALPAPHTPWLPDEQFVGKSQAGVYGDFVLHVDDVVGRITNALEQQGIDENTLVIFSSDNGPVWYPENVEEFNHNSVGKLSGMKGDAWEGGHRLPFIVRWKGKVEAGTENHSLVCFTDLLATFAELVNIQLPDNYINNSLSFLPSLLEGGNESARHQLVMRSSGGVYAVRNGDWKLIQGKGSGGFMDRYDPEIIENNPYEGQLYNLSNDLAEKENLYEQHPEKVQELTTELENLLNQTP